MYYEFMIMPYDKICYVWTCLNNNFKKNYFWQKIVMYITHLEELAKKWFVYFEKLLNCEEPDKIFYFNQEMQEEQGREELTYEEIVTDKYS